MIVDIDVGIVDRNARRGGRGETSPPEDGAWPTFATYPILIPSRKMTVASG